MGDLYYADADEPIAVPDGLLSHLKVVITTKLRRRESFTISWRHPDPAQPGRSSLWIHPSIELRFVFDAAEPEPLDRELLRDLAWQAETTSGILLDFRGEQRRDVAAKSAPEPDRVTGRDLVGADVSH